MTEKLKEAYKEWQLRKNRIHHPDGKFDGSGHWYPSEEEAQECCRGIRNPSRAWPYSLLKHCRSYQHVARLYGVEPKALLAYGKEQGRAEFNWSYTRSTNGSLVAQAQIVSRNGALGTVTVRRNQNYKFTIEAAGEDTGRAWKVPDTAFDTMWEAQWEAEQKWSPA